MAEKTPDSAPSLDDPIGSTPDVVVTDQNGAPLAPGSRVITEDDPEVSQQIVWMAHATLPNNPRQKTTRQAYEGVWKMRGWVLLEPDQALASEAIGRTVFDMADLSESEHAMYLVHSGLAFTGGVVDPEGPQPPAQTPGDDELTDGKDLDLEAPDSLGDDEEDKTTSDDESDGGSDTDATSGEQPEASTTPHKPRSTKGK